jgi:hypothetical protein
LLLNFSNLRFRCGGQRFRLKAIAARGFTTSLDREVDVLKIMGITRHVKVDIRLARGDVRDHAGEDFL